MSLREIFRVIKIGVVLGSILVVAAIAVLAT
jgi:hypothetical protein